jgi:hypothetical protein
MIQHLIVNGCSYMEVYAVGSGHHDLCQQLGLPSCESLALGGSSNSRIIRTTAKHAATNTTHPTLYVLGMTFINRWELPVALNNPEFEGAWRNPQSQLTEKYLGPWTLEKTRQWADLNFAGHACGAVDLLEDLMYRLVSLKYWLESRGHRLLVFRQINDDVDELLDHARLDLFGDDMVFVNRYRWASIPWQMEQQVPESVITSDYPPPPHYRHRMPGHHQKLNYFLTDYIKHRNLLR